MGKIAYVNGTYLNQNLAVISIEDRGFQFADAVYEVWSVFDGELADREGHLDRLTRSLGELSMAMPMSRAALLTVIYEVIRRNQIKEGLVYLQISRGQAPRDHVYKPDMKSSLVITAKSINRPVTESRALKGITAFTYPELRWGRCDIKTTGLLANCMGKTMSHQKGGGEVLFLDDKNQITEAGSSNAYMIDHNHQLITRPVTDNILAGITRSRVLALAPSLGLTLIERPFSYDEALKAKEVFITASTALIMPITAIDEQPIGNGESGLFTLGLRKLYLAAITKEINDRKDH
jgi:D-alanine transaminase